MRRLPLFDQAHRSAFRLFNRFTEGCPELVIDLYASTLVFYNYADDPMQGLAVAKLAQQFLQTQ